MFKKFTLILISFIFINISLIAPAHAILPDNCGFSVPRYTTNNSIESYSNWLKRQKLEVSNNNCFNDTKAVKRVYDTLSAKVIANLTQGDKNAFNKRYDSCTKGTGVSLNPATWLTSLKCLFTTSFFPTSDVIKVKFNEIVSDFKSHQPTSYIPISLGVITNLKNNWGGVDCSAGSISAQVTVPTMTQPWKFVIPCKPPTPLQVFRNLMVLSVWLGFAFWLYRVGSSFWKERSA